MFPSPIETGGEAVARTTYFQPEAPAKPSVRKAVTPSPDHLRRQDQQVEWLRLALAAKAVPPSLGVGSHKTPQA
jgi:hypothetical protein